jgi:rubrerythrin
MSLTFLHNNVLYETALKALNSKKESTLPGRYLICPTCGNTCEGAIPNRCGICITGKDRFLTVK